MISRRSSVKLISCSLSFPFVAKTSWAKSSPNETVNHASFGGAGMAGSDLGQIKSHPNVVVRAIAEIDPVVADKQSKDLRALMFMRIGGKCWRKKPRTWIA